MVKEEKITKELSKSDSKMIQGLSVMAMVWLHLFCTFDYEGKFQPLLFFQGVPLSFYIAQLCDFCVFGFAFVSGYGHMAQYGKAGFYKSRLKGALSVLCCYWCVLIVTSLVSILTGHGGELPKDGTTFFLTALTIKSAYNGAWWYMFAYLFLSVCSPIMLKMVNTRKPLVVFVIGIAIYCSAYYVRFRVSSDSFLAEKYGPVGMTVFEFLIGAECCHLSVFSRIFKRWITLPLTIRIGTSFLMMLGMLYAHTAIVASLFVAPITGFILITLFHFWEKHSLVKRFFLFIGDHSTNIWLIHMFFYTSVWGGIVYRAVYPAAIYLLMMLLTIGTSCLLKRIELPLQSLMNSVI